MTDTDTHTARRRRRRVLYLAGVVPSILLLLLSARIALVLHHQGAGLASYAAADFADAEDHFAGNQVLNPVQRWVAPFAEGGARYRAEDFPGAVTAFELSLQHAPEEWECAVRVNLALAKEAVGDAAVADGDRQTGEDAWRQGRTLLEDCLEVEPDRAEDREERERAGRAAAVRVDDRLARKLGTDDPLRPPRVKKPPPPEPDAEEKEQLLEERNERGYADRARHRDEFDDDPRPSPEPTPVPQW